MSERGAPEAVLSGAEKVALAARLYREFYAACFWHMKPDLVVTEAMIPLVVKGLRTYGGRRGMLAAVELGETHFL